MKILTYDEVFWMEPCRKRVCPWCGRNVFEQELLVDGYAKKVVCCVDCFSDYFRRRRYCPPCLKKVMEDERKEECD